MAYNFSNTKKRLDEIHNWLVEELKGVRVGRATPALVDNIDVKSYGGIQPLKHLASISIDDPKTLRVTPWDKGQIGDIQSAIDSANLGISTSPDDTSVRVIFPDLNEEKRQSLVKIANTKAEDAKVSIRKERERTLQDVQTQEKAGEISEDEMFRLKKDLQKMIDESMQKLDDLVDKKTKEIEQ